MKKSITTTKRKAHKRKMMKDISGKVIPTINGFKEYDNGGKGSGNFGHSGRPGEVGGSGDGNRAGVGSPSSKTEMKTRIKKSIDSWVEGPQDERSPSEARKILKEADDYIRSIGKDPKESRKVWDKLAKKEKDAVGELKVASEDALLALVGEAKHHLSNPDETFSKGKVVPYYRKAYESLRKISDYLGGENRVSVGSDINGPFVITRKPN